MELPLHKSIAYDQGREMMRYAESTQKTSVDIYFCDPHSSNGDINGLIRQYLSKGTDLSIHFQAELNAIAYKLNWILKTLLFSLSN